MAKTQFFRNFNNVDVSHSVKKTSLPTSVAMEVDEEARSNVSRDHSYLGSCSPVKQLPQLPPTAVSKSVLDDHFYTNKQLLRGAAKRKASLHTRLYFCARHFFVQNGKCSPFSRAHSHASTNARETSRIFPRNEQTFASARRFGVIS